MTVTIKLRRGLSSEWLSIDPVLLNGEPGFEYDTGKLKIGDGSSSWSELAYVSASGGGGGGSSAWGDLTGVPANLSNIGGLTTASGDIIIASGNHLFHVVNLAESIDDRTAQLLVGGSGVSLSYNDAGNSLSISATGLALSSHTHTASNITDFNSSVSGLLPVKNIIAGTGMSISSSSGMYTVNSTGEASVIKTTVFNKTGSPISKFKAVYINGGQGDQATITLAFAGSESTSSKTYGITAETINNMSSGSVIVLGSLTGVNTDQFNPTAPVGDVNGTTLWLSPSTSGDVTTTKPTAPNHAVSVGTIVRTHQNAGVVEVRIQNGYEIEELHNVKINGVASGQALVYNSANTLWENKTLTSSLISGFTEDVQDVVGNNGFLTAGTGITLSYNDAGNSLTIATSGLASSSHTHTVSNITDFNSSVSGLLPVKNITAGTGISVSSVSGTYTITNTAGGSSGPTVVSLTFATTLNTDASAGDIFDVTLTDNVTLANPTNPTNGKTLRWRIKQDNTGGRTVALGNKFVIPVSASSPLDFSTSGNAIDLLGATYYSSSDKWHIVAFVPGYI